jgi:hypothetical protein
MTYEKIIGRVRITDYTNDQLLYDKVAEIVADMAAYEGLTTHIEITGLTPSRKPFKTWEEEGVWTGTLNDLDDLDLRGFPAHVWIKDEKHVYAW